MDFLKKFIPTSNKDLVLGEESSAFGIWKLYPQATHKGQPVSALVFSESLSMLPLARNYLKRLKTVKHPNVLAYIQDDDAPESKTFKIIVERVQPVPWDEIARNEAWREWFHLGAHNAMEFCSKEAQLIHSNIPNAFLMAADGSARLAGFEVAAPMDESAGLVDLAERLCDWFRSMPDHQSFKTLFSKFGALNKHARLEQISNELLTLPVRQSTEKDVFFRRLQEELSALPMQFVQNRLVPALLPYFKSPPLSLDLAKVLLGSKCTVALEALIECPERAVRMMLLDNMGFVSGQVGEKSISQLLGSINDPMPALRDATLKASLTLFPKMTDKQRQEAVRGFFKLCADEQPSIRTNALICLSKTPATHLRGDLAKTIGMSLRDSYPAARKAALAVVRTHGSLFTPDEIFGLLIPAISPLVLDKNDMDIPVQASALLKLFITKGGQLSEQLSTLKVSETLPKPTITKTESPLQISKSAIPESRKNSKPESPFAAVSNPKIVTAVRPEAPVEAVEEAPLIGTGARKMRLGAARTLN